MSRFVAKESPAKEEYFVYKKACQPNTPHLDVGTNLALTKLFGLVTSVFLGGH